jgi:hypothetical protein
MRLNSECHIPAGSSLYKNRSPRIMQKINRNNCDVSMHLKLGIMDMKILQFYVFFHFF